MICNNYELYDISNAKIAKFIMAHNLKRRADRDDPNIKSIAYTIVHVKRSGISSKTEPKCCSNFMTN